MQIAAWAAFYCGDAFRKLSDEMLTDSSMQLQSNF